jgi:hypothetical protein
VAGWNDDGERGSGSRAIFDPGDREAFVAAVRSALSVVSTSLFILDREIPKAGRSHKVSKHLARIERHLETLAKLIGVEGAYLRP